MSIFVEMMTPPCAHGGPAGHARMRVVPEDFVVREWLGFEADGEGEHFLLTVRKRGANTLWVAKQLARLAKVHPRDVGFAGLKDRDAVTEQSFTVPARSAIDSGWPGIAGEGFEVLAATRHRRKLKRGALRGNEFAILLRDFTGDTPVLEQRLATIAVKGVPNYFGPQRFGRSGYNLQTAVAWFSGAAEAPDRVQRGFALSAARSAIFNAVLAQRVTDATWNQLQPGDIVNLNGSGSIFPVETVDDVLNERCRQLDVHPTGPMWDGTSSSAHGPIAALEQQAADRHSILSAGLSRAGLEPERRALRMQVSDLAWTVKGSDIELRFRLPRGSFATAVLHELIANAFAAEIPEADA